MSDPPQYPGPDPAGSDDPFDRPPNESGRPRSPEPPPAPPWAAPGGAQSDEPTAPISPSEVGYWERKAAEEKAAQGGQTPSGQAQSGQARGDQSAQAGGWTPPEQSSAPPPYAGYGAGATSGPGGFPPPYGQPTAPDYYAAQQLHPQATTSLVLGLVGLIGGFVCCLPLVVSPFAWVISGRAKREIDASNGQLGGRGNAQAGYVMGIIGTVLLALAVIGVVLFVVLVLVYDNAGTTQF